MCPPVMFRICCWLVCSGVMVWCDSGGGGGPTSLMIWLEQISSLRLKFVFWIKWQIRGKVLFKFKSQPMMKSWVKKSKNLCSFWQCNEYNRSCCSPPISTDWVFARKRLGESKVFEWNRVMDDDAETALHWRNYCYPSSISAAAPLQEEM